MVQKKIVRLLISITFISITGCAINQPIKYYLGDIKTSSVSNLKDKTIFINTFSDNRRSVSENEIVFSDQGREAKIDDKRVCINSERHYKDTVGVQFSEVIAKHITQRGAFKTASTKIDSASDFYLSGNVRQYYAQSNFPYAAAILGGMSGVVGGVASASASKKGQPTIMRIEITDISVKDKDGNVLITIPDINEIIKDKYPMDANCWGAYWNINRELKIVLDKMISTLESKLLEI